MCCYTFSTVTYLTAGSCGWMWGVGEMGWKATKLPAACRSLGQAVGRCGKHMEALSGSLIGPELPQDRSLILAL